MNKIRHSSDPKIRIIHYGDIRSKEQYDLKTMSVYEYWDNVPKQIDYGEIDP